MLLSRGGITLLGLGVAALAEKAGLPAAMLRVGGSQAPGAPAQPQARSPVAARPRALAPNTAASASPGVPPGPHARVASAPQYYVDDTGPMAIALTMDDGPHPIYTPQVLEVLDRYGVKATFNMIGEQIAANLRLVREVAAAGHVITNHTWDHADMRRYPVARLLSEIDRCNDALADAGQTPTIFRAPYGYWTPAVFEACAARGLRPLGWSVDPQDWDTGHVTAWEIAHTVLRRTRRHDIILEHDGGGDRSSTVAALQIFLPELLERGFVFTAV